MDAFTPNGGYRGTDALGRPLNRAESLRLGKLLRDHDFVGASLIALRFAYKLTKNDANARDIMGRVQLRLVETGWDPAEVKLVARLNRLVFSEATTVQRDRKVERKAEEKFLLEQRVAGYEHGRSPEQLAIRAEDEREDDAARGRDEKLAAERVEALRAHFEAKDDWVNLTWMKYAARGITEPRTISKEEKISLADLDAARRRRVRAATKIVGLVRDEEGTSPDAPGGGSWT